jgi:murein DD-endopeptidase MepM/ murein hydrolase activator NlpD
VAKATHIQEFGNQLAVLFDDGTKALAYPTTGGLWYISAGGGGGGTGDFSWPFDPTTTVSSEYGPRNVDRFHEGIDFGNGGVTEGVDIFSAGAGVVEEKYFHVNFGNLLIVNHGDRDGFTWRLLYAHMVAPALVNAGDTITKGQHIGDVGNTGASFGNHLHWETHKCALGGSIVWNTNDDGGFRTAINPRDFMATYGDGAVLNVL